MSEKDDELTRLEMANSQISEYDDENRQLSARVALLEAENAELEDELENFDADEQE